MFSPIRSIQARAQNWMTYHFEFTKYGRSLSKYRDCHKGMRCFFIGNGPSLRSEDLTVLHDYSEICFGFNRIYNIFETTKWRPTYYVSQDEKMLKGCVSVVDGLDMGIKFIPINLRWYHNIQMKQVEWFLMKTSVQDDGKPIGFSNDIQKYLVNSSTVMYTAAQLASYMGFEEIYLLGVDHHFHISQNNQGEILVDPSAKDYFVESYNADKDNLYIPNTEKSTLTYISMKEECEKRGIKIYNATRGGKLEVFPRVSFDSLF